jgi:hypothetical protein
MKKHLLNLMLGLVLATSVLMPDTVRAQSSTITSGDRSKSASADPGFIALQGRWVRTDGGYVITIKSVEVSGKLDAVYANPNLLPFAKAEASRDGTTIKIFLELRAGGYNGSTYTLTHDPATDVLKGTYFQAVVRQKFDVYFARAKQ